MLKNNNNNRLLPTVLEGLGRFAHLINIDFFDDLISVLKNIMMEQYKNYMDNKGHITSACTAFHCIIAAFQLLFKQGKKKKKKKKIKIKIKIKMIYIY